MCGLMCGKNGKIIWYIICMNDIAIDVFRKFVSCIFSCFINVGNKMVDASGKLSQKKKHIGAVCLMASMIITAVVALMFKKIEMLFLVFLVAVIYKMVKKADKILLSVTGFLFIGILYWGLISMLVNAVLKLFAGPISREHEAVIMYIVFALAWCVYSLIANNKVASTANEILSAVLGVLTLTKDMIVLITDSRYFELLVNFMFIPVLITNIMALVLCVLKGYWIEKYNDSNDVKQRYHMSSDNHDK